jgi:hypothetical protein
LQENGAKLGLAWPDLLFSEGEANQEKGIVFPEQGKG